VEKLISLKNSSWFINISEAWRVEGESSNNTEIDLNVIHMNLSHRLYKNPKQLREDMLKIWLFTRKRLG
jgi:hypothetical protein